MRGSEACFVLLTILASSSHTYAQGFGRTKKKIVLHRKLPPIVQFHGNTISVKVVSTNPRAADLIQPLSQAIETEILKNDNRLSVDNHRPDALISCSITGFSAPPPQLITRNTLVGKSLQPQHYYLVTGSLNVAYQAKLRSGRSLDAANLSTKYAEEFDQGGNELCWFSRKRR